jgi:hypothetical protein
MIGATTALTACGTGQNPLDLIDSSESTIEMDLPFTATAQSLTGYSSAGIHMGWILPTLGTSYSILAPVGGLVVAANSAQNASQVTIRVNSTYQVTVASMLNLGNVRAGDEVSRGDTLGTTSTTVTVSVERNGTETCPYPYFSATALDAINLLANAYSVNLCD